MWSKDLVLQLSQTLSQAAEAVVHVVTVPIMLNSAQTVHLITLCLPSMTADHQDWTWFFMLFRLMFSRSDL